MKTSRKPRTTKTRTKSDAYFSLSDEEIDRRAHEYDEARDRAALVWKGIGKQARKMNAVAERAETIVNIAKAKNAMVDFEDLHVSYECRDKNCTMCKWLMDEGTGRLATMSDTGEVRVTDPKTGGQKGKKLAQLGAIDPASLLELAKVAGYGQANYARFNYLKGFDWSLLIDALYRHLLRFQNGEELDPESGLSPAAHVAWHALALVSFSQRKLGTDDGYRPEGEFAPEPEPEEMS